MPRRWRCSWLTSVSPEITPRLVKRKANIGTPTASMPRLASCPARNSAKSTWPSPSATITAG